MGGTSEVRRVLNIIEILGDTSYLQVKALAFVCFGENISFVAQAAVKCSSQLSSARISE